MQIGCVEGADDVPDVIRSGSCGAAGRFDPSTEDFHPPHVPSVHAADGLPDGNDGSAHRQPGAQGDGAAAGGSLEQLPPGLLAGAVLDVEAGGGARAATAAAAAGRSADRAAGG